MSPAQEKTYTPRLKTRYAEVIVVEMGKRLGVDNPWALPRLAKIVLNMGVGQGKEDIKYFDQMKEDLSLLTGQASETRRAKKSIAGFKIRKGQAIGLRCTLRGVRMWEFLDRLISIALPRIRDFRGLEPNAFDGDGNYNLGLREHHIFPEINVMKSPKAHGINITFVTTGRDKEQSRLLLELLGFPFRKIVAAKGTLVSKKAVVAEKVGG